MIINRPERRHNKADRRKAVEKREGVYAGAMAGTSSLMI